MARGYHRSRTAILYRAGVAVFALQHAEAGVATSIFACFPLLAIFLGARVHRERVTVRTIFGSLVSILGIVLLYSRA